MRLKAGELLLKNEELWSGAENPFVFPGILNSIGDECRC
jgi:hypothetical protein